MSVFSGDGVGIVEIRSRSIGRCAIASMAFVAMLGATRIVQAQEVQQPAKKVELAPCGTTPQLAAAKCGTFDVFENREKQSGRRISLHVVVIPSKSAKPAADPLFYLVGGPGYGAASSYVSGGGGEGPLSGFRETRDIVFVDYRGTGTSHPLVCPIYPPNPTAADLLADRVETLDARVTACRDQLSKDADLTQYTTPNIVDDLDDVRAAVGYNKINLYGTSYGSRVAMIYLRRHPEHLRAVILEAVEPPPSHTPLYAAKGAQYALDRVIKDCVADAACHAAFPSPKGDLDAVLGALAQAPAKFQFAAGKDQTISIELSLRAFTDRMIQLLYNPGISRMFPYIIHEAAKRDFAPFASAMNVLLGGDEDSFSRGMYLSVMCSEDVAWITDAAAARETSGTLIGTALIDSSRAACKAWPRTSVAEDYTRPVSSAVPVLLLAGDLDPVTPAFLAKDAAQHLSNSLLADNPFGGHGTKSRTCQIPLMEKFIEQGSAKGLDASCVAASKRPPFITDDASANAMLNRSSGT